ncbi:MAG: hypothetical protein JF591_22570 [Lysobacter sp.]|nr:hypothetical protein [Lysobacter sp.]
MLAALPFGSNGWQVTLWFATANRWLRQARPIDLEAREWPRLEAAALLEAYLWPA